jgi:hypothetical protein
MRLQTPLHTDSERAEYVFGDGRLAWGVDRRSGLKANALVRQVLPAQSRPTAL